VPLYNTPLSLARFVSVYYVSETQHAYSRTLHLSAKSRSVSNEDVALSSAGVKTTGC